MPSQTGDSPADFHRLSLFLARRTGDADYSQVLAMDAFRWAQSQTQDVPFGALLAASARPAAAAIRERDNEVAQQASIAGIIASLRPMEREVLRLVYWDHLSMGELADYLGCSMTRAGALLEKAYRHADRRARRLGYALAGSTDETA
ncbi:sigma-70 family RNA polymerase sigma factor [Arthrobacter sp. 24S4-2]|uniref:sigma factor-like helix-turn-helix DNA-binding protein n=1 Tax=Arthrobacter sp. 24S4-2 TaxID=2575374 RepID=UPI0010C7A22F|nr:sigma factor-like helix-turn-helix DNA-binding protein [Arthrobacter sp. 24S4-2]QCO99623.1 sigma-70 family RNA polymerase sigma factor [Arthrobacter sp. 24S4-2]